MKVLLTIWISAVLIQEVIPSTLVRLPRRASNQPSLVHTEYEAKYEQKGKNGNESSGLFTGKQEIVHDKCTDDWNAFADKCAALIKDLVASLANAVSSRPGDATNLQLQIKNTFRHFDNTNNCTCFNRSDIDLSPLFNNITVTTIAPSANVNGGNGYGTGNQNQNNCGGNGQSCDGGNGSDLQKEIVIPVSNGDGGDGSGHNDGNGNNSGWPQKSRLPNGILNHSEHPDVSPEGDGGSDSTNNSRRQIQYPQISRQPKNSQSSYPEKLNNINKSPYPFLVTPQPNSAPNRSVAVPYSNDNNSLNRGPVGKGFGSDGQTPPGVLTLPTSNGQNSDGNSKPVEGVPAVVVPADDHSDPKSAVIVPAISAPDSHYLVNDPLTDESHSSNTTPVVPTDTKPVSLISKTEDNHPAQENQIVGVPVINSDSNLPESEGPDNHEGNTSSLLNNPGPNPSIKEPNSAIPEVLPVSNDNEPEQLTSVNYNPTLPEADNQQSGIPSVSGSTRSHPRTHPVASGPVSNAENSDPTGGNDSGNGSDGSSQRGASVTVYPVYVPNTEGPSALTAGQPYDGSSQSNAGSGPENGSYSPSALNAAPVHNSENDDGSGSNTGSGIDPSAGNDNDTTRPVVVYPGQPQGAGQNGQGNDTPYNNAGSGPNGGQSENDPRSALNSVPVINPTSQDGDGSDSNGSGSNGSGSNGNGSNGSGSNGSGSNGSGSNGSGSNGSGSNGSGSNGNGSNDSGSNTGSGIDPNAGNGNDSTSPVVVYPDVIQGAGQNGQGSDSPQTNAGLGSNGDQSENDPKSALNSVPVINPTSQDGDGSDSNTGSGNDSSAGSGNDATSPVVVYPDVTQGAGQNGQGNDSPYTNAGSGPNGGESENDPKSALNSVPVINPTSQDGDSNGSNGSGSNGSGSNGNGSNGSGSNGNGSNGSGSNTGSGNDSNAENSNDATSPVVVFPNVTQGPGQNGQGSDSPQTNAGSGPYDHNGNNLPIASNAVPISNSTSSGVDEPHVDNDDHSHDSDSGDDDSNVENPTTFQTTSSDPTSPQSILIPTESAVLATQQPNGTVTVTSSPQTKESHEDDEDDEDCCSCESCTEEEITDPKQYKENACKNLEEARRELKAIFDKIKKKLKCGGRKALQTITTTESVNSN